MQLFYSPEIANGILHFDETESKHAVRVLRLKTGDEIHIIDGIGTLYKASITDANQKKCSFQVLEKISDFEKRPYYLHIAIAPTKNIDRLEWFLEKATEIGIDEITPLLCDHSERKIIKPERLNKILVSAAKQSLKAYIPKLNPLQTFHDFIMNDLKGQKCIAHCYDSEKTTLKSVTESNLTILIGPEGDFSPEEVKIASEQGFQAVSLGNSRLRTETAGVVACHTVSLIND